MQCELHHRIIFLCEIKGMSFQFYKLSYCKTHITINPQENRPEISCSVIILWNSLGCNNRSDDTDSSSEWRNHYYQMNAMTSN